MSPDQVNNSKETRAVFSMGNPPGQLELLQRALQHSKAESHEKDKKIRECTTTITNLENSLEQESARVDELESELHEKTTETKALRTTLKKRDREHALLQEIHHAAEEQSTKDAQEIHDLRLTTRKQRGALESTQKETRELDEGNGQLQGELARAKELADTEYQRGFNDAQALVREASKIENPGPWGGSLVTPMFVGSTRTSAMSSSSARMSTGSGSARQEPSTIYSQSRTSQTSNDPGQTLEQELADLDESDLQNPVESPWTGSDRTGSYDGLHDDLHDESALEEPEPYHQADPRDVPVPPLGKSDLATETVFMSDDNDQQQPQPQPSPCARKPDLSEGRREDPGVGVRMVLMSTLAWWWWWWQVQAQANSSLAAKRVLSMQVASGVASGVVALTLSVFVTLGYMWWTDGAWQWQQANQSPWSVYHERCIALGSDSRWLLE